MDPWETESLACTNTKYEALEAYSLYGNEYTINDNFTNDGQGIYNE